MGWLVVLVYVSGTVVAHAHVRHEGGFDDRRACHTFQSLPDQDSGVCLYARGPLVEESSLARLHLAV